jgi:hypothetical protein
MNLRTRPVRVAAAVGAVVAAGTTVFMAVAAGTASADEPGRCTQNVNVREEADATSKIVAMCDTGTAVTIGPERDGFAYLENLHGWASKDFIKADETAAATTPPAGAATPTPSSSPSDDSSSASADSSSDDDAVRDAAAGDDHASDADSHSGDATTRPSSPARSNSGGLGGLLG